MASGGAGGDRGGGSGSAGGGGGGGGTWRGGGADSQLPRVAAARATRLVPPGAQAIVGTQLHHCGYALLFHVAGAKQPEFHDWHHRTFKGNFGLLGLLDRLHGTDAAWRAHVRSAARTKAAERR